MSYSWYLDKEICVEQHNVYFTVIGQVYFTSYGSLKPNMQMREIFVWF